MPLFIVQQICINDLVASSQASDSIRERFNLTLEIPVPLVTDLMVS